MKNKGIILGIVIVLIIAIIGVTIYFTSKSIIGNDETNTSNTETETNNEENTIGQGIQDNPDEDNLANIIATPNDNEGDGSTNFQATP